MEFIKAILETLKETGGGAPESPLFLAFQAHGVTYDQFHMLLARMEQADLISRQNHTVSLGKRGEQLLSSLNPLH